MLKFLISIFHISKTKRMKIILTTILATVLAVSIQAQAPHLYINGPALGTAAGSNVEVARFQSSTNNSSRLVIHFWRHTTGLGWPNAATRITAQTDATNQGYIDFNPIGGNHGITLGTWLGGSAININASAAVGIGTWDTRGYKLAVVGGVLADRIKVAVPGSAQWADYVFAKDYKLMPLAKVEQYIKANKHLPNVPSAAEMVKEGNDLVKTDAKLLEKIEELTLYLIETRKLMEAQAQKIAAQQKEIDILKQNKIN